MKTEDYLKTNEARDKFNRWYASYHDGFMDVFNRHGWMIARKSYWDRAKSLVHIRDIGFRAGVLKALKESNADKGYEVYCSAHIEWGNKFTARREKEEAENKAKLESMPTYMKIQNRLYNIQVGIGNRKNLEGVKEELLALIEDLN